MYAYKRLMVGLDLTVMDETVIAYTHFLCECFRPEKIYFVHVAPDLNVPKELREEFPEFQEPRDEVLRKEMQQLVEEYFPSHQAFNTEYKIIEGSRRTELLRWTHIKDADLLICGRKQVDRGSGVLPMQLARKARCSIFFVPEQPRHQLKKLWIATDFSPHAQLAMEEALQIAEGDQAVSIIAQHVYSVPMGYYKTGKTEQQFAAIMQQHAEKRYQQFLESIEGNTDACRPVFTYDHNTSSPATHIVEAAKAADADLIMVGARGRNLLTALFLGSVAEKLIKINDEIPMLLVKRKDKTFDFSEFFDAI